MKRFYKHDAESDLGAGTAYLEIIEGWPTRQVEVYRGGCRWADKEHNKWLADQPFEVLELDASHEIDAEEFEAVWREVRRCPPRL